MSSSSDFLYAGSSDQRAAVNGIMRDHAFEKHGQDVPGADRREFGASAMRDLNTADRVYEFDQEGGKGLLFSNTESGMVGWVNTADPEKSTYFAPEDGVENYIADKVAAREGREITAPEIAEINAAPSPDHAQQYHEVPEVAVREVEVSEPASPDIASPEVGATDDGPSK